MPPTRRTLLRTTGLVAAGGLLAGCQGDGDDDGTPGGSAATTTSPDDDGGDGGSGDGGADGSDGVTVAVRSHDEYGEILTDGGGMALYLFTQDSPGETTCYDTCADNWPPLTTEGGVEAGDGVTAELDSIEREDGSMQVTAAGWPLYYYQPDAEPGDVTGQGVNDVWYVLGPGGSQITGGTTPTPTESGGSGGGPGGNGPY